MAKLAEEASIPRVLLAKGPLWWTALAVMHAYLIIAVCSTALAVV
jgi:hypothetical protein